MATKIKDLTSNIISRLSAKASEIFNDDKGWIRQGQFTPGKQFQDIGQTKIPSGITLKQLPSAYMQSFSQANTLPERLMNIGTSSFLKTSSFGLVQPQAPKAETAPEKFMSLLGGTAGFVGPGSIGMKTMTGIDKLGASAVSKYAPQLTKNLVGKATVGAAKELAQAGAYTGAQALSQEIGLRPESELDFAKNLLLGTGLRLGLSREGGRVAVKAFGKLFDTDIKNVEDIIQNLGAARRTGKPSLNLETYAREQGEIYRKAYNLMSTKDWRKLSLEDQFKMIKDKMIDLKASGEPIQAGIVDKSKPIKTGGEDYSEVLKKEYDAAKKEFVMLTGEEPRNIRDLTEFKVNKKIPMGYGPNPKTWWGNKEAESLKTGGEIPGKIKIRPNTKASEVSVGQPDFIVKVKSRINTDIDPKAKTGSKFFSKIDDLRRRLESEYFPVEKIGKEATKRGIIKDSLKNPTNLIKRNLGAKGIADGELLGLGDILKPHADRMDDLRAYLVAKRTIGDLNTRGIKTGVNITDAKRTVQMLEPEFKQVAEQLGMYQRSILHNYLVDTGAMSEKAFQQIIKANPNYVPFKRILDELEPGAKVSKKGFPIKKIKGSEREIVDPLESIVDNTYRTIAYGEQNRLWKSVVELADEMPDLGIKKVSKGQIVPEGNVINVKINGKPERYSVPKELATVANNMGEQMNVFMKILSYPTKLVRTGATGANPEFALIRNPIRDQFTALWNTESGYTPFVDMFKGISHYSGNDNLYRQYLLSGAGESYMVSLDRAFKQKKLTEVINGNEIKDIIKKKNILEALQDVSQVSEIGTRLGAFKKTLAKTGDPIEAMRQARDITVDFSRIGKDFKTANQLIPYINARLQGTILAVRSAIKNPKRAAVIGTSLGTVPATMLYLHNRQYPEYAGIEDYTKRDNWVVMYGEPGNAHVFKFPKDQIIGKLFGSSAENFLTWADKTDPKAMEKLASNIFDFASPISNMGEILPSAIKPVVEGTANYNFFTKRPLVQEYQQSLPPEAQYTKGTREVAKLIGSKLNVSPAVVDNYLYGYFPGLFTSTINLVDFALGGNKFKEVEKLPFARVFMVPDTGRIDREIQNAYYDMQDRKKAINSIKKSSTYTDKQKELYIQKEMKYIRDDIQTMDSYQKAKEGGPKGQILPEKDLTSGYQAPGLASEVSAAEPGTGIQLPKDEKTLFDLYKDALSDMKSYEKKLRLLPYDSELVNASQFEEDFTKQQYQDKLDMATKIVDTIKREKPEEYFNLELKSYGRGTSFLVEDRASWAYESLSNAQSKEELDDMLNKMWETGVLTTGSNGTAQKILEEYGIDVTRYTGEDPSVAKKVYGSSSGGRKISIPAKPPAPKFDTSLKIKIGNAARSKIKLTSGSPSNGSRSNYLAKVKQIVSQ